MKPVENLQLQEFFLVELSEFIGESLGLYFPNERWKELERGFVAIMHHFHYSDPHLCLSELKKSHLTQDQVEILASCLTIGETYFFRETESFEAFEKIILPNLIETRRKAGNKILRIWSAACSSGEEAYSIAILLKKLLYDFSQWNITLLATDINPSALKKALAGVYSEWSFRRTPLEMKEKYFKNIGKNKYEILPELRDMVTVAHLNLAENCYPSLLNNTTAMDIIFCRNLLMYFVPAQINQVLNNFYQALSEEGILTVSSAENSLLPSELFQVINFPGAMFYKKATLKGAENKVNVMENFYGEKLPSNLNAPQQDFFEFFKKLKNEMNSTDVVQDTSVDSPKILPTEVKEDKVDPIKVKQEMIESLETNARALANQGKLSEALLLIDKAITLDKCNPSVHFLKALIHQELGTLEDTIKELKKVIYLDSDFILAYYNLGNLARNQGKLEESEAYYTVVLTLLGKQAPQTIIPFSEGMTAERLGAIIQSFRQ